MVIYSAVRGLTGGGSSYWPLFAIQISEYSAATKYSAVTNYSVAAKYLAATEYSAATK